MAIGKGTMGSANGNGDDIMREQGEDIMQKEKIIIFGISKVAQVVYANIHEDSKCNLEVAGFCVDAAYYEEDMMFGLPVFRFEEIEQKMPASEYKMLIAIGYHKMNTVRAQKYKMAKQKGYELVSYIHSNADISKTAVIGQNCIILNNVSIEPFVEIGDDVCVFCNAVVAHHSKVEAHAWITSGTVIGGNSHIGQYCFLGINSTIGHNIGIGDNNFIGAGAVVTKNTEADSVYVIADTPKYRLSTKQFMRLFKFD